jgi:WD40 repeat protein
MSRSSKEHDVESQVSLSNDSSSHNRAPPRAGSIVKHYELLRQLGEGGMGTVYLARDTTLGRLVAIKVLRPDTGPSAQRFLIEAQATARCRHDNIVVIHEVGEHDGYPYMVLEHLEGSTLREWMAQRDASSGPVSPNLAVELMLPVVRALACAHKLGIVHRDLKPENIFLTSAGRIVVLDFGIAKRLDASEISAFAPAARPLEQGGGLTQEGAQLGTLPYMSPEQLRAEDIDARSDLWTVGILLYELITGAHPLAYRSAFELLEIAESEEPMPRVRDRRPDAGALGAIIDRCLEKPRARRYGSAEELAAALEVFALGGRTSELGEEGSLFAGLSAFQEADAERYVGREREVVGLVGRLRNQPLLVVAGPSGVGKSSFVRAGVIPALKHSGERWEAFILRPGRRPLAALADVLAQIAPATADMQTSSHEASSPDAFPSALHTQPGLMGARLRARCRREGGHQRILIFVDQFEELYTLGADVTERAAFVACLEGAADDASSPLRVMLSIRSDFLYRMAEDGHFIAETARGLCFLRPMGRDELRAALTRPLEAAGYRFENETMVEAMLDGLGRTKSPLPLLQFTAAKLWEARDRTNRLLTQTSYDQLGGVVGALSAHANAVLAALSPADQRLCRAVLLRLCTAERTRAVVSVADLRALAAGSDAVEQVIHRLSDARLVITEVGGEREGTTVELCHESLIDSWDKFQQWLTESEQDAQFVARLSAAAKQWEASEEAEGLLWRDRAAREAADWLARWRAEQAAGDPLGLGRREERFLLSVVALSERTRRRRQRIVAGIVVSISVVAVVVFILSIRVERQAARADRAAVQAAQEAQTAQLEARQARNATRMAAARELEQQDPTTMLALLREVEPPDVPRGWAKLVSKAMRSGLVREVRTWGVPAYNATWSPDGRRVVVALRDGTARVWEVSSTAEPIVLRGHQALVWSAAFSPDGTRIVTASDDKTARIWMADGSGDPIVLRGHEGPVCTAMFSPDGTRIVTASNDKTARIWMADGSGSAIVLRGHEGEVNTAMFSSDGQRIVTASEDETARVWRVDRPREIAVLRGHKGLVYAAAFSPDGERVVTGSTDANVRVWRADGTGAPIVLRGHDHGVLRVAFSPDGTRIISASGDKTVRVWSAEGHEDPVVLRGHEGWVYSAAFSPDGAAIVTASLDGTSRLFHIDSLSAPILLRGHVWYVRSIAFSADSQHIVTASDDATARLWNADGSGQPVVLRGHERRVEAAAFSRDGQRIVTGSQDATARVWRTDGSEQPVVLRGHEQWIRQVAFSPDGTRVVTASDDTTARVWRADGSGQPVILRGHEQAVTCAAFSPDGKRVATGAQDHTVHIWNTDGSGEPHVYRDHDGPIAMVTWSPDGKHLIAADQDPVVRVWSADGSGQPVILRGHAQAATWAAWSPDGTRIVTASDDKTARIWNADGSGQPVVLHGHEQGLLFAAFSPDGERIITTSRDETGRIWNADGSGEPYVLTGHGQAVESAAWSPNGARVAVLVGGSNIAWVWPVRAPFRGINDPRLWTATPDCMSIKRRIELLSLSEARARADQDVCERRIKEAGAASSKPAPRHNDSR